MPCADRGDTRTANTYPIIDEYTSSAEALDTDVASTGFNSFAWPSITSDERDILGIDEFTPDQLKALKWNNSEILCSGEVCLFGYRAS